MAVQKLSDVTDALQQVFGPDLAKIWNRKAVTGSLFRSERGSGKNVAWSVLSDGASADSRAEGADVVSGDFDQDQPLPATLAFAEYSSSFSVTTLANMTSMSTSSIGSLEKQNLLSSFESLSSKLNVDLISGDGTDVSANINLFGLVGSEILSSGSYAGIDPTTYTLWKATELSNGSVNRPLTSALLDEAETGIFNKSGAEFTHLITSPGVYNKYKQLFNPVQRVADGKWDSSPVSLEFSGRPVIRDKDMPAGTILLVNADDITKVYHEAPVSENEVNFNIGELDVPFQLKRLAESGSAKKFAIFCWMQLCVKHRNQHAIIKDIAEWFIF